MFQRNPADAAPVPSAVAGSSRMSAERDDTSTVVVSIPSNNIRNANLSGSFHDYTTTSTLPEALDDPSNPALRTHSIYEPQPSSSQQARLGVVAIPNLEFSPSPPESQRHTVDAKPPNDFIV